MQNLRDENDEICEKKSQTRNDAAEDLADEIIAATAELEVGIGTFLTLRFFMKKRSNRPKKNQFERFFMKFSSNPSRQISMKFSM